MCVSLNRLSNCQLCGRDPHTWDPWAENTSVGGWESFSAPAWLYEFRWVPLTLGASVSSSVKWVDALPCHASSKCFAVKSLKFLQHPVLK